MDERRKVPRHRTLKAGHIAFNRAGTIDCRVRNLSPAGACLEVASQIGIPDRLVLVVERLAGRQLRGQGRLTSPVSGGGFLGRMPGRVRRTA